MKIRKKKKTWIYVTKAGMKIGDTAVNMLVSLTTRNISLNGKEGCSSFCLKS